MIRSFLTLGVLTLVTVGSVTLGACKNPADDKAKATVSEPGVAPAAGGVAAGVAEPLTIASDESKVGFVGSKVTGSHDGSFPAFTGKIDLVDSKAEKSKVTLAIDTTSVKTDNDKLTGHLKSPDFFDTAKYPKAAFESTEIKVGGEKGASHTITGNLDLHGVKKKISFPATIKVAADAVTTKAEFAINRKDFGINYAGKADDLIRDEVVMKLDIKAPRKKS